jgi:hypothetical protein
MNVVINRSHCSQQETIDFLRAQLNEKSAAFAAVERRQKNNVLVSGSALPAAVGTP